MDENPSKFLHRQFYEKQHLMNKKTASNLKNKSNVFKNVGFDQDTEFLSPSKIKNNDLFFDKKVRKQSYGNILKQQITTKHIDDEFQMAKSRKMDESNARYCRDNYHYGEQGIKVRQQVVQKYKVSTYNNQKDMLQKFRKEAEELRKNKVHRYNKKLSKIIPNIFQSSHINDHQRQLAQQRYMQLARKQLQEQEAQRLLRQKQERQKQRRLRNQIFMQRQQQNMVQVSNMLRQIGQKIKDNNLKLNVSLIDLHNSLKRSPPVKKYDEQSFVELIQKMSENRNTNNRMPVVMYNHNLSHNNSRSVDPEIVKRTHIYDSEANLLDIVKILKKNQARLQQLTQLSHK